MGCTFATIWPLILLHDATLPVVWRRLLDYQVTIAGGGLSAP